MNIDELESFKCLNNLFGVVIKIKLVSLEASSPTTIASIITKLVIIFLTSAAIEFLRQKHGEIVPQ